MASPIAELINSTPELKKKLSDKMLVVIGQKHYVIDPNEPSLHVFNVGEFKGKAMMSFTPIALIDVKGNKFEPQKREPKVSKAK